MLLNRRARLPESPPLVALLDTSVASRNLGDRIIMEAVHRIAAEILPDHLPVTVPTHDSLGRQSRGLLRRSAEILVGGTNLLSSSQGLRRPWRLGWPDAFLVRGITLLGVAWNRREPGPGWLAQALYRRVLSRHRLHSVRDEHAAAMLREAGIRRVVNTGCPTMWELDDRALARLPAARAPRAVVTLTGWLPDPERDRRMLQQVAKAYEEVWFWPQMAGDSGYLDRLAPERRIRILPPRLEAYDRLLSEEPRVDHVGTRLHAGIRALQRGRRSLVLAVDHRATEIGRCTGLPVIERGDDRGLQEWLETPPPIELRLPREAIEAWKAQFAGPARSALAVASLGPASYVDLAPPRAPLLTPQHDPNLD